MQGVLTDWLTLYTSRLTEALNVLTVSLTNAERSGEVTVTVKNCFFIIKEHFSSYVDKGYVSLI